MSAPVCHSCGAPRTAAQGTQQPPCPYCGALPAPPSPQERREQQRRALARPALAAHRTAVWAVGLVGLVILAVGGASVADSFGAGALAVVLAFAVAWIAVFRGILKASSGIEQGLSDAQDADDDEAPS